jgi:hypothetical protein
MDKIAKAIYDNIGSKIDHRNSDQKIEDYYMLVELLAHHHPEFVWNCDMAESTLRYVLWRDCNMLDISYLHWPDPTVIHSHELPDDMGPVYYDSDSDYDDCTVELTEQGPVAYEKPGAALDRWAAFESAFNELSTEIADKKIAEGLSALGPPPQHC